MSLLIVSLLFSAVFNGVLCDKPDAETVKKVIAASNQFFKEKDLSVFHLGGFYNAPILFNGGRISSLDTLELQGDPEIDEEEDKDGVRYDYKVKLALKEMNIKYQYEVELPLVHPKGIFNMNIGENSFYAEGHVFLGNDGSCSAVLNDFYVNSLNDYQVHLNPEDSWIPFLMKYLDTKEAIRGRRFSSDEPLKEAVHSWLASQPKTFFHEGIRKLEQRWTKCVKKQGDYVEK